MKKLYCYSRSDILKPETLMEIVMDPEAVVISISSSTDQPLEGEIFGCAPDRFISLSFDDISPSEDCYPLHAMTTFEAKRLQQFIEANKNHNIYVHCDAGRSRSQGVVRFILDFYGGEEEWEIRKCNPPTTPNCHVVASLKAVILFSRYNRFDIFDL